MCSPRLKDVQREIARRIEDYTWPAAEATQGILTERLTYFRIPTGEFVLTRTLPLEKRDALKRAGRFHAHALILDPEEFRRLGCDPFAVFDHFAFQSSPDAAIESGEWRSGEFPDGGELTLAAEPYADATPMVDVPNNTNDTLPLLIRWLAGPDDPRPMAIPAHPTLMAGWLRNLFRRLPTELREVASFDTLSSGQALGTIAYRFVGGFDLQTVRDWPYRRAYRLDLASGKAAPNLPEPPDLPGLDHVAKLWTGDPPWPPADIDASYRLHRAMADPAAGVPDFDGMADGVVRAALESPGAKAAWDRWVNDRVHRDVPQPALRDVVAPHAKAWYGEPSVEKLDRLARPLPSDEVDKVLLEFATAQPLTPTLANELCAVTQSRKDAGGGYNTTIAKLRLMALAGAGKLDSLEKLFAQIQSKKPEISAWFFDLVYSRSQVMQRSGGDPVEFAAQVLANLLADDELADFDLWAALYRVSAELPTTDKHLALAQAFRRENEEQIQAALGEAGVLEWATSVLVSRAGADFEFGWDPPPTEGPCVRMVVRCAESTLGCYDALFESMAAIPTAGLLVRHHAQAVARDDTGEDEPTPNGLKSAFKYYDRRRWDKLRPELEAVTNPADFRAFLVDKLHDKSKIAGGPPPARWERTVDGRPALWVGWSVQSNGQNPELFNELYKVVAKVIRSEPGLARGRTAALIAAVTSSKC